MANIPIIRRSFERWIAAQDESLVREASSVRSWILASLFVFLTLPILSFGPGLKAFFQLRLYPALLCFVPVVVFAFGLALRQRNKPFDRIAWGLLLLQIVALQFFCASLVAWSGSRGAAAIASLFLFACAYHGHLFRATLDIPWIPGVTVIVVVAAALLNPSNDRIAVLSLAGFAAVTAELILGTNARNWASARHQTEGLRAAVHAQILMDHTRQVERLSDTVADLVGRHHDLGNSVMALQLAADRLDLECRGGAADGEIAVLAGQLRDGIGSLCRSLEDMKASYKRQGAAAPERIEQFPIVELVCNSIRARYPSMRLRLVADASRPLWVSLRGGAVTLHRVLENLLINACEGDGTETATSVEIKLLRDRSGGLGQIVISDDGPGFRPEDLGRPIEGFQTRKPHGTGLGLYTSERLVQASGGSLERANRPEGGAMVTVSLPFAADPDPGGNVTKPLS